MVFLSVSAVRAGDIAGGFLDKLTGSNEPHAVPQPPAHQNGEIFKHAEVTSSGAAVPSKAEELEGQQADLTGLASNEASKNLQDARVAGPRDELQRLEKREGLARGHVADGLNNDESLERGPLDLKLSNSNPSGSGIVRKAEPVNGL